MGKANYVIYFIVLQLFFCDSNGNSVALFYNFFIIIYIWFYYFAFVLFHALFLYTFICNICIYLIIQCLFHLHLFMFYFKIKCYFACFLCNINVFLFVYFYFILLLRTTSTLI